MYLFIFRLALLAFSLAFPHLLSAILALEMISLVIYFSIRVSYPFSRINMFRPLLFLAVAVSEGAVGLRLIVLLVHKKGYDFLYLV